MTDILTPDGRLLRVAKPACVGGTVTDTEGLTATIIATWLGGGVKADRYGLWATVAWENDCLEEIPLP